MRQILFCPMPKVDCLQLEMTLSIHAFCYTVINERGNLSSPQTSS